MNKKKIIVFLLILLICSVGLVIKDKFTSKEDIYVLTNNEKVVEESTDKKEVTTAEHTISNKEITVYISGEVNEPGIVTLNEGDRLATAVEKVGGTTKKADLNGINMAIKVQDEMHYIIPKIGESVKMNSDDSVVSNNADENKEAKININTASIEELDKLPGVGEATANKIVNYRSENGDFKTIEELKDVNGIGDKKFEEMKDLICLN